jgi:hypothetical protein
MRLLFGAMAGLIFCVPALAQVDPKIAEMCMKAQDFSGCVQTMTGGDTTTKDEVQKLRSVMKQVAARLDNGISYRDSTNMFQPLVDQLAIAKEGNKSELAVKVSSAAEILFNIMQESWYNSIKFDGIALGANEPIRRWNSVIGTKNIKPLEVRFAFGVETVDETAHEVSVRLMYNFVSGILKEGAVKQQDIGAFNKKRDEAIRRSSMDSWARHLDANPGMAAWAKANPAIAETKRDQYNQENPVEEIKLPTYTETLNYLSAFSPSLL